MKKLINGCHFINVHHMEKYQITDPLEVCVSGFRGVNGNGILALVILKKIEKRLPFHTYASYGKMSNY